MASDKKLNILFTSVGRRVELVRFFRKAYEDLGLEGKTIAVDIDPLAPALWEVDKAYIVPPVSDPEYISTLKRICCSEQVDLIFPLIDPDIPVLSRYRGDLEDSGAKVVVVPEEAAFIAGDKWLTYKFFCQTGVPTPKSWLPQSIELNGVEYPLFIKPRFGSAGKGAFKVNDERELLFFMDYVSDPIIQEYIPGPEITNDVLCDFNGNVIGVVSRQRIEVRWGEVAKGKTIIDNNIMHHCVVVANALQAIGPITVQCILRDGKPYFTEINPRFGGGAPLGFAAGMLSPHWLLALASGLEIDIPPLGTYKVGLYMTRFDDSFFLTEEDYVRIKSCDF